MNSGPPSVWKESLVILKCSQLKTTSGDSAHGACFSQSWRPFSSVFTKTITRYLNFSPSKAQRISKKFENFKKSYFSQIRYLSLDIVFQCFQNERKGMEKKLFSYGAKPESQAFLLILIMPLSLMFDAFGKFKHFRFSHLTSCQCLVTPSLKKKLMSLTPGKNFLKLTNPWIYPKTKERVSLSFWPHFIF